MNKFFKTHGEAWYEWKCRVNSFSCKFDDIDRSRDIPQRMSRADAVRYYNKKCRDAFESLGYTYKVKDDFSKKFALLLHKVRTQREALLKRETMKIIKLLKAS